MPVTPTVPSPTPSPEAAARRLLWIAGGLTLLAVALGGWICAASGVPAAIWGRNLVAWAVGAAAALGLARLSPERLAVAVPVAALALIAATFAFEGQQGVRRWVELGQVSLNAALLILPALAAALAVHDLSRDAVRTAAILTVPALLALQPDASQATAFGLAAGRLVIGGRAGPAIRFGVCLGLSALLACAWLRPDPLAPVAEVEEVLGLALALSPALAAAGVLALLAVGLAPVLIARRADPRARFAGEALGLYLLASAAMPALGAFPTPLVGVGVSPVLGAWMGFGVLAALMRKPRQG